VTQTVPQTSPQRTRTTAPELPTGEISLQSPPLLPKSGGQAATQLMFMLPMMLGMGAMSFVYIGRSGGAMTYIFGALYGSVMIGMVVMSLSRGGAQKRAQINDERRDYQRYLTSLRARVREVAETQRSQLGAHHPPPSELWSFVASTRLWERRRHDADFGQLRIGLGPQRLVTPLRAPQTVPLEDLDPVSSTALRHFIRTYSTVEDLPVALSLRLLSHIELSGARAQALATARALICQAATFHGPWDLRIALCVAPDRMADWQWLKWLPHLAHASEADAAGPRRLVAGDSQELVTMFGGELGDRPVFNRQAGRAAADQPHILVIADGGLIGNESALTPEFGRQGVSVLDLSYTGPVREPRPGLAGIYLTEDRMGMVTEEGLALLGKPDQLSIAEAEALSRQMSPLYTIAPSSSDTPLTSNLGLPGLLGLGDPRDVDPAVTWRRRSARERLRIPIGIDPEGRPVELDLKESAESGMGPHGLVIGATGSGKSELLRTLVIGLAVTHSSETLNFALIDFKGGATFAGLAELPHVSAVITNLSDDLAMVDRMADAISGEVLRRQELLRAAGNYASVRDYERARESGVQLNPLPSLLVIIDEFSELLSSRPEFIDLFVMIGRLGRSLGIHLLLASQRLEEGRLRGLDSHLSYRIGLRTFSASESRAVLGVADAYELPSIPGSAFLKIDTTTLIRLKAAFVSGALPPRRQGGDGNRRNAAIVPFGLAPVAAAELREIEAPDALQISEVEQPEFSEGIVVQNESIADTLVSRMLGKGPAGHQIWLPPLGAPPSLDQLLPPLSVDAGHDSARGLCAVGWAGNGRLTVPLAVVDKPFEQRRDLLWADLSGAAGNAVVAGGPQTGKSTLLRSLVSVLALTHTPAEVQFFLLDMGGGALASLAGLPHTSGYANRLDVGTCRRIVAEVATLLSERERQFNEAGIDSVAAFRQRRAELAEAAGPDARNFGDVFLVIDGFATFRQEFEVLEDIIGDIAARGLGYGIHLVLSTTRWTTVKAQVRDMLGTRFELALGDPADSMIDRKASANIPQGKPGRGVTPDRLHFLTALPRLDSQTDPTTVAAGAADLVTKVRQGWSGPPAPPVRLLPDIARLDALPAIGGKFVPIGIAESNLAPIGLDFSQDPHFLAFADVESGKTTLLRTIAHGIMNRYTDDEVAIIVVDYRRGLLDVVQGRHLLGYAGSEPVLAGLVSEVVQAMRARIPGPDVTAEQLRARNWWTGPELFLIVDDYDLVAASASNPLLSLVEFLPQARDIGLHVVLARATGGAGRGLYEPVVQRLRELGSPGLVMSGSKDEGVLLGTVKLGPLPPGRGTLVSRRAGQHFMQVAWTDLPDLPVSPTDPPVSPTESG
jgi:S-DNA-T family DNA segregation ATPase FtsK/SpoIIIE